MAAIERIVERLGRLETSSILDANKALRVVSPAIQPVNGVERFAGRAHTVFCRDDFLPVVEALTRSRRGDVLVVRAAGGTAVAGEIFTTEAIRRGLAALVIDGACRDTGALRSLSLPVFARRVTPLAGATQQPGEGQVEVVCGGVRVRPGEIVVGDSDGLVVLSEVEATEVVEGAEAIQAAERRLLAELAAGRPLRELLNLDEHIAARRAGRRSSLKFLLD